MSNDPESNLESENGVDYTLEPNKATCKNCEQEHEAGFGFCPHCGQKANDDLTVGILFYNTISNYFSFDARFFKSFIPLMFKPGILAKRFIEGKRLLYLHPAQMYLFISIVFFFLFSFKVRVYNQSVDSVLKKGFELEQSKDSIKVTPIDSSTVAKLSEPLKNEGLMSGLTEVERKKLDSVITLASQPQKVKNDFSFGYDTKKLDSLITADAPENEQLIALGMNEDAGFIKKQFYKQLIKFHKNKGGGALQALFDSIPISLFILLPIFALILKVFFWRRGSFAHHLVFSFYFFSFLFTVFSILLGVNYLWEVPDSLDMLLVLFTFFYLFFAIKRFYQQGWFLSFFKTSTITFVYMMFVLPIAAIIMLTLAFLFY